MLLATARERLLPIDEDDRHLLVEEFWIWESDLPCASPGRSPVAARGQLVDLVLEVVRVEVGRQIAAAPVGVSGICWSASSTCRSGRCRFEPGEEAAGHPVGELVSLRPPDGGDVLVLRPSSLRRCCSSSGRRPADRSTSVLPEDAPELDLERLHLAVQHLRIFGRHRARQNAVRVLSQPAPASSCLAFRDRMAAAGCLDRRPRSRAPDRRPRAARGP